MKNKYTFLQPTFYKDFKCSGNNCEINCCSYNWGITVDKDTYFKYRNVKYPNDLVDLLNKYIKKNRSKLNNNNYGKIVHIKEKIKIDYTTIEDGIEQEITEDIYLSFCPFQDENKLCKIHKALGEDGLCTTCKIYPRVTNNIFSNYERSLSIGCEEVSKLLYNIKDGISFELVEVNNKDSDFYIVDLSKNKELILNYFDDIRITCLEILQYRNLSLDNRMILLSIFMFKIDEFNKNNNLSSIPNYINNFFNNIQLYEPILNLKKQQQYLLLDIVLKVLDSNTNNFGVKSLILETKKVILTLFKAYLEIVTEENNTFSPLYNEYKENRNKLMKDKEYFIENIFVNLFFVKGFPFNGQNSIKECCIIFIFNYIFYKGLLSGYLAKEETLNENILHRISTVFGRTCADQPSKLLEILNAFKNSEIDSLAFLAILIKSA
ncbi:flagellin lysine-N-methylase [[Clostridium] colinum]|uniref:flagellin lysine-N-methylase n=1 Tax=[Clostridium] colinum TaxID=36835 RepID=UPI0020241AFB|nr:flagellin lysine-N-methylase [[Clostridium] colinum]